MNLIVFDLDGTLTRTNEVDDTCFVRASADALGIHELNTNWTEYEHVTDAGCLQQAFLQKFNRKIGPSETTKFIDCFLELLKRHKAEDPALFQEIPGASSLIRHLKNRTGWIIAIATGCWAPSARFKMEAAGIPVLDLPAAFADDGPSRESIVRAAIERAGGEFDRIISVGDAIWDVQTARRLGLPFVGVGGARKGEKLRQAGASHTIEDFRNPDQFMQCIAEAAIPTA